MSYHYFRYPRAMAINDNHEDQNTLNIESIALTNEETTALQQGQQDALMMLIEEDDEQGKLLVELFLTASEYPSANQVTRLKMQHRLMKTMQQLIKEIEKDIYSYRKMGNEFKGIADEFRIALSRIQTEASKMLNRLLAVNSQLSLIVDELLDSNRSVADVNKENEMSLCLEVIKDLAGLDKFGEASAQTFHHVSSSVHRFQQERIEPFKTRAIQQYEYTEKIKATVWTSTGTLGVVSGVGAGAVLGAPVLGGAGTLVIGSVVFPPGAIIAGAIALGFLGIGALVFGIRKFLTKYHNYQTTIIRNLEYLALLCEQMKSEAVEMIEHSNKISKNADDLLIKLRCATFSFKNEKQRQTYAEVCAQIKTANQTLIETLKSVVGFESESLSELKNIYQNRSRLSID